MVGSTERECNGAVPAPRLQRSITLRDGADEEIERALVKLPLTAEIPGDRMELPSRPPKLREDLMVGSGSHRDVCGTLQRQHRRALDPARAEVLQRLVGSLEGVDGDLRLDSQLDRQRQQLLAVAAGEVGDRAKLPLLP